MKSLVRVLVFSYLSLYLAQSFIKGFEFGSDFLRSEAFVVLGLSLLYTIAKPVFGILPLPTKGLIHVGLIFIITLATLYALTSCLPTFKAVETVLPGLSFLGFVLPSKHLNAALSLVASALVISMGFVFFNWLCSKKR